jgi:hypothetical protein
LIKEAEKGNFNAAKWVADKGWESRRGRPSKEEKEAERKKAATLTGELADEASRVIAFRRT